MNFKKSVCIVLSVLLIAVSSITAFADGEDLVGNLTFFNFGEDSGISMCYRIDGGEINELDFSEPISLIDVSSITLELESELSEDAEFGINVYTNNKEWTNGYYDLTFEDLNALAGDGFTIDIADFIAQYNNATNDNAAAADVVLEFENKTPQSEGKTGILSFTGLEDGEQLYAEYALDGGERFMSDTDDKIEVSEAKKINLYVKIPKGYEIDGKVSVNIYTNSKGWKDGYTFLTADQAAKMVTSKGVTLDLEKIVANFNNDEGTEFDKNDIGIELGFRIRVALPRLKASSVSLKAGQTSKIEVLNQGKNKVSCKTSNYHVATVKDGKVTALKAGKATVKVTVGSKKFNYTVKVTTSPKLSKSSVSVKKGQTVKVKISGKASSVNNVYYNTSKAKITSKNTATTLTVKGLKKGSTTLKVRINGVVYNLSVNVK